MFDSNSFIYTFTSTDRVIRIVDLSNTIVYTINVCKYKKATVINNFINIYLEGYDSVFKLDFVDNDSALSAINLLRITVDTLKINCQNTIYVSPPAATVTPLSYLTFKSDYTANMLVDGAWYDITDTTSLFSIHPHIYRTQVYSSQDGIIQTKILNTNIEVLINVINDELLEYIDASNHNYIINKGILTLTNSSYCKATTNGTITAVNSNNIISENTSTIICIDSANIRAINESQIIIRGLSNCNFDNIQMSSFIENLNNITVNQTNSIGKNGTINNINPVGLINLYSYFDVINQNIEFTSNNNTLDYIIDNHFPQANAKFIFKNISSNIYTNNKINIKDSTNTIIAILTDNEINNSFEFNYNKTNHYFEFNGVLRKQTTTSKTIQFLSPTNGQTDFLLKTPVTQATEMEMYINGSKQVYNVDFYYNSGSGLVIYTNWMTFPIESTEIVEFRVY